MELCERPQKVEVDLVREIAEQMDVPEGSKVEILGGRVYVTAAPMPKHVLIAHQIMRQMEKQLPADHCATTAGVAVAPDIHRGDFAIPDLVLTTLRALSDDRGKLPVEEVELVAEVVSRGNAQKDIEVFPELYALWKLPVYLLIDPRTAEITVYSEPFHGVYGQQMRYGFHDGIELPLADKNIRLDAAEFPRYASR